jgi:hypothetical protein
VDDYPISGWKMEDILGLLVGKEGTPVVLGLRRSAEWDGNGVAIREVEFNVTLTRSVRALPRDHVPGTVSVMTVIEWQTLPILMHVLMYPRAHVHECRGSKSISSQSLIP